LSGKEIRWLVRSTALTTVFPASGFLLCLLAEMLLNIEVPRLTSSIINWLLAAFAAFLLFPRILGIPFGRIRPRDFSRRIGLYLPPGFWKYILLGVILASCTLSGMLIASVLTGKYRLGFGSLTLTHLVFCLNPGVWEEVFYRGIQMMILLRATRSLKRAAAIQVVIFGLSHIKGIDALSFVDAGSVMVLGIGFTYAAWKTGSLLPGIVFHYLHDTFVFVVQVPSDVKTSVFDNALFYIFLWSMVALGCLITRWAVKKSMLGATVPLYTPATSPGDPKPT